jgi:hypothetical protein
MGGSIRLRPHVVCTRASLPVIMCRWQALSITVWSVILFFAFFLRKKWTLILHVGVKLGR